MTKQDESRVVQALAELVRLKDLKDEMEAADPMDFTPTMRLEAITEEYHRCKAPAWEAARKALAAAPEPVAKGRDYFADDLVETWRKNGDAEPVADFIARQKPMPPDIAKVVDEHFDELVKPVAAQEGPTPRTDEVALDERDGITHPELYETYMAWTDYWALLKRSRQIEQELAWTRKLLDAATGDATQHSYAKLQEFERAEAAERELRAMESGYNLRCDENDGLDGMYREQKARAEAAERKLATYEIAAAGLGKRAETAERKVKAIRQKAIKPYHDSGHRCEYRVQLEAIKQSLADPGAEGET
jgi:hypothetical protein